uniref:phosphoglucomutase (alpha-D-glucose-1,6-bisphosphate-dependent) n=1 Tax=Leersia perrieri TaxID=77586 RepID=A0A0D9WYE1_9ORYZ
MAVDLEEDLIDLEICAALSGKIIQNAFLAQHRPQASHSTRYPSDFCALNTRSLHSFQECRLRLAENMRKSEKSLTVTFIAAAQGSSVVSSSAKVDFLKLQNGSDIRGVAVAGVEGEPVNLTEPVTEAIAAAFAAWLLNKKKADGWRRLRISIGHDSRISAHKLQNAVTLGITTAGHDVLQFGLASTPAMFNSTLTEDEINHCPVDGAIMITASHLPYNRNGLKFFTSDGGLNKADIKDILERASRIYEDSSHGSIKESEQTLKGEVTNVDYMSIYASDLVKAVRKSAGNKEKPLEGLHIVVDAGNGAGGFFVFCDRYVKEQDKVLKPLGAITTGSQFLEPDGMFPNHIPNPEDKTAMKAITQAVGDNKADLGIIFDTDVDRSAAVDSSGCELNRNRLIALMSAIVLEEHPGTTIVTDSVTSDGLTTFIENKLGGKHHRFKRGYKNVIDEAIRLNTIGEESHLAMETSGHGALKENHWLDDGAYLMVKLLNKLAAARILNRNVGSKVLTDLVEGLEEAPVTVEIRLKIDQNHADLKGGLLGWFSCQKRLSFCLSTPKRCCLEMKQDLIQGFSIIPAACLSWASQALCMTTGSFRDYGEAVLKHLENAISRDENLTKAPKNYEGLCFHVDVSCYTFNTQAPSKDDAIKLGLVVLTAASEFPALDITALNKFLQQ